MDIKNLKNELPASHHNMLGGVMGLAVGDALGVPIEFCEREALKANPVISMREYGTHNQPAGTWSDDTSLTIATLAGINYNKMDYENIMKNFFLWMNRDKFTATGKVFDIGSTTMRAISNFMHSRPPLQCGCSELRDNGNGGLMRILPAVFYFENNPHLVPDFARMAINSDNYFNIIHNLCSLTHAHNISKLACDIYVTAVLMLMKDKTADKKMTMIKAGQTIMAIFKAKPEYFKDSMTFSALKTGFFELEEQKIKSSGYVLDTLLAAFWCFGNTNSYDQCVLKAVNLGGDTDTIAGVAGGMAGIYYGYESIPQIWLETLANKELIIESMKSCNFSMLK